MTLYLPNEDYTPWSQSVSHRSKGHRLRKTKKQTAQAEGGARSSLLDVDQPDESRSL